MHPQPARLGERARQLDQFTVAAALDEDADGAAWCGEKTR
jgi:hypothetical protein